MGKHYLIRVFVLSCSLLFTAGSHATTYYIDQQNGSDHNTGDSKRAAWQTLDQVNRTTFLPGDSILFKRGNHWIGQLKPQGSGAKNKAIVLAAYGAGAPPVFDAQGKSEDPDMISASILLYNQEYWEFRDIEVRNFEKGNPARPLKKAAILILAKDIGTLHDFTFENLKICKVNGSLKTRTNGGLFLNVIADEDPEKRVPTNFDGIYVNNCLFQDVDRGGFLNQSFWRKRDFHTQFGEIYCDSLVNNWFPSYNLLIENCKFENIGGNGLVTRVAESPVVQDNLFIRCGSKTTGNASYPYNCNNALWQFNEAAYTIYNEGDVDASGFDSDYLCKNSTIQYNYSHHNDWGGLLVCSWAKHKGSFNDGTVVRKNVFQEEKHHLIRFSGNITNTRISENLFVVNAAIDDVLLWYKEWGGIWPDQTILSKNIFYNTGAQVFSKLGASSQNTFSKNRLAGSDFSDYSDFKPLRNKARLQAKIDKIRSIGNRKDFTSSSARAVIKIMWSN